MWDGYHEVIRKYSPISLQAERKLIALAQDGHQESRDELLLRHVGFVICGFRTSRSRSRPKAIVVTVEADHPVGPTRSGRSDAGLLLV